MHRDLRVSPHTGQHFPQRDLHVSAGRDGVSLRALGFDGRHNITVHTHPRGEHRPAFTAVHQPDSSPITAATVFTEKVDQLVGRFDGVRADAQGAGEDVGRASGNHRYRGHPFGGLGPAGLSQQPVDHLIHGCRRRRDDDHVDAVAFGVSAISTAWAAMLGVCDDELHPALRACASRSRPALVVEVAFGFTISTARTLTYRTGVSSASAPSVVRYAGFIAAAEGAVAVVVAAVLLVRGSRVQSSGSSTVWDSRMVRHHGRVLSSRRAGR